MSIAHQSMAPQSIQNYRIDPVFHRYESDARRMFKKVADDILMNAADYHKGDSKLHTGMEIEYSLLKEYEQASEEDRDLVIKDAQAKHQVDDALYDKELGAAQLELRTEGPPPDLIQTGFQGLENHVGSIEQALFTAVREHELLLLRSGSNPFVPVNEILRTTADKYRDVPNHHDIYKRFPLDSPDTKIGSRDKIEVRGADIISLTNAVQFLIDAQSLNDAIDKVNRSLMISPYIWAVSGNARYLDGKDSEMEDLRMLAWEISHDTRTADEVLERDVQRVGLPDSYHVDMRHYFNRSSSFPTILVDPNKYPPEGFPEVDENFFFYVSLGIYWNDVRLKFNLDRCQAIVEFRPISTQPSLEYDMAIMAFYIGRLAWSQKTNEPLLDLGLVRQNRYRVMRKGLSSVLWQILDGRIILRDAKAVVRDELKKAEIGLEQLQLTSERTGEYFNMLKERLEKGTPAAQLSTLVKQFQAQGFSMEEALTQAYLELGMLIT